MCSSIYLGALKAAALMGHALGKDVTIYSDLLNRGSRKIDELFNGEFFQQKIDRRYFKDRHPENNEETPLHLSSPEAVALSYQEGPEYQYGKGCLSDGVIGQWFSWACGVG